MLGVQNPMRKKKKRARVENKERVVVHVAKFKQDSYVGLTEKMTFKQKFEWVTGKYSNKKHYRNTFQDSIQPITQHLQKAKYLFTDGLKNMLSSSLNIFLLEG